MDLGYIHASFVAGIYRTVYKGSVIADDFIRFGTRDQPMKGHRIARIGSIGNVRICQHVVVDDRPTDLPTYLRSLTFFGARVRHTIAVITVSNCVRSYGAAVVQREIVFSLAAVT